MLQIEQDTTQEFGKAWADQSKQKGERNQRIANDNAALVAQFLIDQDARFWPWATKA